MSKLYVIAEDGEAVGELCAGLTRSGHTCVIGTDTGGVAGVPAEADAVLLAGGNYAYLTGLVRSIKRERDLPVIALVTAVDGIEEQLNAVDEFLVSPWDPKELELRVRRLLRKTRGNSEGETIKCGDLTIDLDRYEVFVGGRLVALTFKEYELLRFLARSPDRVFTREALLDKVWGYDYYGGDRTVDVHIQRLRSKIEGSRHVQIETVRNIGYRLRTESC